MTRKNLTLEEKHSMEQFHADHPKCWMCLFLNQKQVGKTQLHHIAGRGSKHNVAENYAALCARHHRAIQSRADAELACLVLKRLYDREHYAPQVICNLRHRATTCWTENDVELTARIMEMMKLCKS